MIRRGALVLALLAAACSAAHADTLFSIPWGSGAGQIGYFNPSNTPGFDQPYAEGPGGFAVGPGGEVWVSDTFNDRILRFERSGQLKGVTARVAGSPLRHPRCLWVDEDRRVAVYTPQDRTVLAYDRKSKVLQRLVQAGDTKQLVQVEMLTGTPGGDLVVGDFGASALVQYGDDGKARSRERWGLSGLAVDARGRKYTLDHREDSGGQGDYMLVSWSGSERKDHFLLHAPELAAPVLVGLDAAGNCVVRFMTAGQVRRFVLVRYDPQGHGQPIGEVPLSPVTQQFVVEPDGAVLGLSFDAARAPAGAVEVVEFR